jgi:hypothetical protein
MKIRHAAALALVGWYLIAPPPRTEDGTDYDPKAPLSEWQKIGKFETIEECRTYPARLPEIMHGFYVEHPEIGESGERRDNAVRKALLAQAQCVATDDPRLKEK